MALSRRQRAHSAIWLPREPGGTSPLLRPQAVYPLLGVVVVILGMNWPFMAVGLRSISALWMSAFRLVGAAVTLFVLAASTGRLSLPPKEDYPIVVSVAARQTLMFVLLFSALEIVPAGRSSILIWTASLWTVPIAVIFIGERMNRLRTLGLTVGIAGVLLVFEPAGFDWTDGRVIVGHVMLLSAAMVQAAVSVHVRHHSWTSTPLGLLPWQMLTAAVPVLAVALVTDGLPTITWTPQLAAIVIYQGTFASGFAIWGQLTVLRGYSAISMNLVLMTIPVIGLTSSAVLLGEALGTAVVGGLVLVLAGVTFNKIADSRT